MRPNPSEFLLKDLEREPQGVLSPLTVDPQTLKRLNWTGALVSRFARTKDLESLVAKESVGHLHTWSMFTLCDDDSILTQLKNFENARRPTEIFFYYGLPANSGRVDLFGAAAIAEKIHHRFPHSGFPVIARCLIAPAFRQVRLYSALLKHRFQYCIEKWGDSLMGIHLGSGNPAVYHAVNAMGFTYFGLEHLGETEDTPAIHDFLWMTERLKTQWQAPPPSDEISSSAEWMEFQTLLRKLFANRFDQSDYLRLTIGLNSLRANLGWSPLERPEVAQTIDLMDAIPIYKTSRRATPLYLLTPDKRRKAA